MAFHSCTSPDCGGVAELLGDYKRFQCPVCSAARCVRCQVDWHEGQTCEQYQEWRADNAAGDDAMADMVGSGDVKVCVQCGNGVVNSEGCNHMTCRCGAHFCHTCNADIGPPLAAPYTHFESGVCKLFSGDVYDED